jgi:hypothetical protein
MGGFHSHPVSATAKRSTTANGLSFFLWVKTFSIGSEKFRVLRLDHVDKISVRLVWHDLCKIEEGLAMLIKERLRILLQAYDASRSLESEHVVTGYSSYFSRSCRALSFNFFAPA